MMTEVVLDLDRAQERFVTPSRLSMTASSPTGQTHTLSLLTRSHAVKDCPSGFKCEHRMESSADTLRVSARRIRPFYLFNKLRLVNGRIVDFDTMLFGTMAIDPTGREARERVGSRPPFATDQPVYRPPGRSNLRGRDHMLPVLVYLGGDLTTLAAVGQDLAVTGALSFSLFG